MGEKIESPIWKQEGKPYQINKAIIQKFIDSLPKPKPKLKGLFARLFGAFTFKYRKQKNRYKPRRSC